jgi:excisionase family DNA binding protein
MWQAETNQTGSAPAFVTVAQAAVIINVSEKTIRRLIERGIFECSKAIRKKLIPRKQLETFFERTK